MLPTRWARTFLRGRGRMRLERAFRLSAYLTLGLSCACLSYTELAFLTTIPYFPAAVGVLLLLAFFLEGRWSVPVWAANVLGGLIAAAALLWMAYLHQQSLTGGLLIPEDLSWPVALLPYIGPLLMLLLVVKVFR